MAGGSFNTLAAGNSFLLGSGINYTGADTGIVYLADDSRGLTPLAQDFSSNTMICRFENGMSFFASATSGAQDFLIDPSGRVGIGVSSVTKAQLEIDGFVAGPSANGSLFSASSIPSTGPNTFSATSWNYSIFASHGIASDTIIVAVSDERIKKVVGRSDLAEDLAILRNLEVTDYTYIDTVNKGTGTQRKLIAQQVEKFYPQAIGRTKGVIPDIYEKARIEDGWVSLDCDLTVGERVRLFGKDGEKDVHEVREIRKGAFRTDFRSEAEEVFVYGREVDDYRNVDYDAIAMLNVSATQELARKLEVSEAAQEANRAELLRLRTENEALASRLAQIENLLKNGAEIAAGREIVPRAPGRCVIRGKCSSKTHGVEAGG